MSGVPEGCDALLVASVAHSGLVSDILYIARDDGRMARLAEALRLFAPDIPVLEFPGWDCVPYDRVSPHSDVVAARLDTLVRLAKTPAERAGTRIVLSTISAVLQRVPPKAALEKSLFIAKVGLRISVEQLIGYLNANGYARAETVMEPGEYAVRGGIIDVFPPGSIEPLRIDLFGDDIETIRTFDVITQRSTGVIDEVLFKPVCEVLLDALSITRFRANYRELFGVPCGEDALYENITSGVRIPGMEHWLPLFYDGLDTIFLYLPASSVFLDPQVDEAGDARWSLILEYFEARQAILRSSLADGGTIYHPVVPTKLFLGRNEFQRYLSTRPVIQLSRFSGPVDVNSVDVGGRVGRDFSDVRSLPGGNVFESLREHINAERKVGRRVAIAAWTEGSRDRLFHVMQDHGIKGLQPVSTWLEAETLSQDKIPVIIFGLERGIVWKNWAVVTEQDLLGDRLARPARKKRRGSQFISDSTALSEGDLVVHVEHGIGRYDGLLAIEVGGAPHDCIRVTYDGGDKLFIPVENLDVLTRYGSEQASVQLDKLGSSAWQARKAKLKKRILDMASQLIAVAAERQLRNAEVLAPVHGIWDEFCARFPYAETEDQLRAIEDIIEDLASGRPMDRLICGDVGFGKTEVALRAAFIAVMAGFQVAVVVPTTLLARQHYRTFSDRFQGLPVRVEQLSRLVPTKLASAVKKGIADGSVDIVIGTHSLLAKGCDIKRLGLMIIDEEQHFGVAHKERLKQLRSDIHVLTLTATPIPRTLQMALTGVKEMSVIATPPIDRLAVRTFVLPFDPVIIREAILRERYRGGQVFYVCPRLVDIDQVAVRLAKLVPEVNTAIAHGRLSPSDLEDVMVAFGDKKYDVLLSTNIIESGLDMPSVNTLIIHRADMFGLGQLYQLRGRVGRGKTRGYSYFTLPSDKVLSKAAERRLQVMQALDTLGAGFQLASHDLDIRGAGNLLGDEQSGHIKEVGIELYQQLLEEAVTYARDGGGGGDAEEWSPQIAIGSPVLIPEDYVRDLSVRLSLYRRIANVTEHTELDALAAELIDRFGKLPVEVENLFKVIGIKSLSKKAGIEKIEAGPKGVVISFRGNTFANPAGLIGFISQRADAIKIRPDHKVVYFRNWVNQEQRVAGVTGLVEALEKLAREVS